MVLQEINSYVVIGSKKMTIDLDKIFKEKMIAGGFCPDCGDFLIPRKKDTCIIMECINCNYREEITPNTSTGTLKKSIKEDLFPRDPTGKKYSKIIIKKHWGVK